ncbi:prepilin-type N-terminal cleavage/methylation domain-containing protein [Thalassoroseus pseudoceratinae]|uniref:prepilin-type N-terminal cleavage/methylation domain-containing protein n=1 Tax=Thalassoroseus pseudoceratinae TaxID=2713176 RepID=UPI0014205777|nr:prepilin-type N-terminal cleavage/methylation domain-containing protein [Thalassoroseus pseudoceratinae]
MRHHRTANRQPVGFTLVELLVVIGIIGFLITISGVIIGNMLGTSKEAATKATIAKVHELIMERSRGFDVVQDSNAQVYKNVERFKRIPDAKSTGFVDYRVGFRKATLRQSMPTRLLDLNALTMISGGSSQTVVPPATQLYTDFNTGWDTTKHQPETLSSELMYFALTNGIAFFQATNAADQFTSSEVMDTDGDGRMEFVDAWGKPLRFYFNPTRLFRPGGNGASLDQTLITTMFPSLSKYNLNSDPDDPNGKFLQEFIRNYLVRVNPPNNIPSPPPAAQVNAALVEFENTFHTPSTYQVPLVVSAGPDGELGLYEAPDAANFGHLAQPITDSTGTINYDVLYDNITNYQGI